MKTHVYILLRKLVQAYRSFREYRRPIGPLLFKHIEPGEITLRRVAASDIKPLETFLSSGDFAKHRHRLAAQQNGAADYLIAWHVVPVGHLLIEWDGGSDGPLRDMKDKKPFIEDVYIHPAVRGKGVGKRLMDEAEVMIAEKGHDGVGLSVLANNPWVEEMYKKRGYRNTNLGEFVSVRVFTDRDGRRKKWSAKVKYLTKNLAGDRDRTGN